MEKNQPITVGRYLLHRKIARGGMATIHIARLMGDVGFSRIVAAKRMHPELAEDKEFVSMFLDEARIASKVHHRNVVPTIDVCTMGEEVVLVQEYVHGAPLSLLLRASAEAHAHVPIPVAAAIACQVLAGLHAAHETIDEMGTPLHIVHRDVSPQNIMVATDGSARLLDFGVAKASVAAHVTRKGTFKGKLGYSSPEQIRGEANKQSDIYSLGVVLWELLVGHRLHGNTHGEAQQIAEIMSGNMQTVTEAMFEEKSYIGSYRWSQLEALEPIIRKALDVNYRRRWATAADMEEAITAAVPLASATDIATWLRAVGKDFLEARENMIAEEEASWRRTLAMTAAAVPVPADAEPSLGVAIERPESELPAGALVGSSLLKRGPTALIAALVVVLVASFAFLIRDLDNAKPKPAAATEPAATRLAPTPTRSTSPAAAHVAPAAPAPAAAMPVAESPPRVTTEIPSAPMELPDDREDFEEPESRDTREREPERERDREPKRVAQKRQVVAKSKPRTTKASPPPRPAPAIEKPSPPPPTKASEKNDCSTPFYYEGNKKLFKPGCL
jgi:serine/threonine-protein kinase